MSEIRLIEQVKCVSSYLPGQLFSQPGVLDECYIQVHETGSDDHIPPQVAESAALINKHACVLNVSYISGVAIGCRAVTCQHASVHTRAQRLGACEGCIGRVEVDGVAALYLLDQRHFPSFN